MHIKTNLAHFKNHERYLQLKREAMNYLRSVSCREVEVPTLSPVIIPEGYLGIFGTTLDVAGSSTPLFLTPHPELFLKRLMHAGSGSLCCISRAYRNQEDITHKHSPEFEMLEFYLANHDYMELAEVVKNLVAALAVSIHGSATCSYQNQQIHLDTWEKISISEAFERYAGITDILDESRFLSQAAAKGYTTTGFGYLEVFSQIYTDKIEEHLGTHGMPTMIYDYPPALAATARVNPSTGYAERWEFYIAGVELGNAANEQANLVTQAELHQKYQNEVLERDKNGLTKIIPDSEFEHIVATLAPFAGIGIGLERVAAILLDLKDICELHPIFLQNSNNS
jgi:elongation factor P--(R)-beta-lysine ligase